MTYAQYINGTLAAIGEQSNFTPKQHHLGKLFHDTITAPTFPCVGAKASLQKGLLRIAFFKAMNSKNEIKKLAEMLYTYIEEKATIASPYPTFAAVFEGPYVESFDAYEEMVFAVLYQLHLLDKEQYPWSSERPSDPNHPDFHFSFGGKAFFVAVLGPSIPRLSRKFIVPAMVFNAHENFTILREQGKFDPMKSKIQDNDLALEENGHTISGGAFGHIEAAQFCGNPKGRDKWSCPFHENKKLIVK